MKGPKETAAIVRRISLTRSITELRSSSYSSAYDVLEPKVNYGSKATVAQLMATIVQSLLLVNIGMELSMPTIVIGSLYQNSNAEFVLTNHESSWFGSILFLCQPIGAWMAGYVQRQYGNKSCVVLACVPSIVGWIMLCYAKSVTMLYISTLTMGLGLGFNDGPAYSYIGEISEPRLRGIMSCVINTACLIGLLFNFGLGFLFHWKTVAALSTLCPVLCLLLVTLIPESPIWLLSKGRNEKAMEAICWLRGWVDSRVVATEYQELLYYYKTSVEQVNIAESNKDGFFSSILWIKDPSVYRPLRLVTLYYIFTLISCLTPCRPYLVQLMYESGVKDTHSIALILFGSMQLIGSAVLICTVRKLGKRLLTLITLSVNILMLFIFGLYILCIRNGFIKSSTYLPMIIYSIVMVSGASGTLTIPWTLVSEIYPIEAKGFASSLTTAIFYLLTFSSTKVYLSVETTLGLSNTFFTLAALSFVGFVFLYKNLPETENKSFTEIEEFFTPKNEMIQKEPALLNEL